MSNEYRRIEVITADARRFKSRSQS